ncbi:hypothetical protein [Micromonospora globbae]|jgi:hypothetical protein|uniref:hypothetical protein n=1 Tax=Micromonospora globbae TaxID=1894969 RepID=UPI0037AD121B
MAYPIFRYAKVLSIGLLLVYAMVSRLPGSRWALPGALAVLLVDGVRTTPAAPGGDGYGWKLVPGEGVEMASVFESVLSVCWAPLAAVAVLLISWRRGGWHRRAAAPAVVGAALISGYATVRVVSIWPAVAAERPYRTDAEAAGSMLAVSMAVLPSLALGMTALALATALAGHGRRLASSGAALLALLALPLMDACIGTVPMPLYASGRNAVFAWDAITPTLSTPQPMPAIAAAVELTAYLMLVAGLAASPWPTRASPDGA